MVSDPSTERLPDVLFVTRKWTPAIGGMETYSLRLTEELDGLARVEVVALPGQPSGKPPGVFALLRFPLTIIARWFARPAVPEVLHLADMAIWPVGLLALLTFGRTRVVLSAHGTDVGFHRRGGLKGRLYAFYLSCGARLLRHSMVVANSRATELAAQETGWHNTRIVALATDMQAAPRGQDGSILFAGRLIPRKGCAWFIREVLPLLPRELTLKVAGTGWDTGEVAALDNPRVRFLGGLPQHVLAREYAGSLCTVVPNIELPNGEFEGFGLVACEAAACSAVVLAARSGGLSEAVIDGTTGILVDAGDARAWARAVLDVANWDEQRRTEYLDQSAEAARTHYAWTRVARQTAAVY